MSAAQASQMNPDKVLQHLLGYAPPLMIDAAMRLGLFDALADGEKSLDDIAAETGASVRGVRILMKGLVGLGLLTSSNSGYALTPESDALLVSGRPNYVGGLFRDLGGLIVPQWLQLTEIVRTGKPAASLTTEGERSAFFEKFVEDIFPLSRQTALGLADALNLAEADATVSVLDVAAGSGVWGVSLAEKGPTVCVTAVDWPSVIPVTKRVVERHGLSSRFNYIEGDLADVDLGEGHHVAILGHILHCEGAEQNAALLKKTFAALAPGGTIAIAEYLTDDHRGEPSSRVFAVNMLVTSERGDTFSFSEISEWLLAAGFEAPRENRRLPCPSPMILATKPG